MPKTTIQSRGVALLVDGPFYAYGDHVASRVAAADPGFSREYIRKLIASWADVATLIVDEDPVPGYAVTVHLAEVTDAAASLPRMFVSFMSAIGGGRYVQRGAPQAYATAEDLVRTRVALVTSGYGADVDVWGVA
ncbi:hypothetical protein ACIPLC_01720 [Kitasatospora sp. NPDC086801]|uniref:hypothetical protein n=1 Tax=Kitasatospora sp. NPDC086801 TaxID=3364066 RepID=UPI003827B466